MSAYLVDASVCLGPTAVNRPRFGPSLLHRLAGSLIIITLLTGLLLSNAETETRIPSLGLADQIKWFISNPAPFEMIAKVCNRDRQSTNAAFACYYVLLRYQTNAFFYREAPELNDLQTTNLFAGCRLAGHYNDEDWDLSLDRMTLVYTTNTTPSTRKTLQFVLAKASTALHLGIFDSLPGSIKWEANTIRQFTNDAGVVVGGGLVISNGLPTGLRLSISFEGTSIPWEDRYTFQPSKSLTQFLPSEISGWSFSGGHALHNFDLSLLEVRIREGPFPKDAFAPSVFSNAVSHYVLSTPDGYYARDRLHTAFQRVQSTTPRTAHVGRVFVILFMAVNLLLAALFVIRYVRMRSTKPNTGIK